MKTSNETNGCHLIKLFPACVAVEHGREILGFAIGAGRSLHFGLAKAKVSAKRTQIITRGLPVMSETSTWDHLFPSIDWRIRWEKQLLYELAVVSPPQSCHLSAGTGQQLTLSSSPDRGSGLTPSFRNQFPFQRTPSDATRVDRPLKQLNNFLKSKIDFSFFGFHLKKKPPAAARGRSGLRWLHLKK